MQDFESFRDLVTSDIEKRKSWEQPVICEGEIVSSSFTFPKEWNLDHIRDCLKKQHVSVRTEAKEKVISAAGKETEKVKLRCSSRYRKLESKGNTSPPQGKSAGPRLSESKTHQNHASGLST